MGVGVGVIVGVGDEVGRFGQFTVMLAGLLHSPHAARYFTPSPYARKLTE